MNNGENKPVKENAAAELKMDYGQPEGDTHPGKESNEPQPDVGLSGGQAKGDPRGLDISSYTGPGSKASNELDEEQALGGTHQHKRDK
jgi:hypothetical protein